MRFANMRSIASPVGRYAILTHTIFYVALDQLSKLLAQTYLQVHQSIHLLPGLNLTLTYNYGAAFGIFGQGHTWQRIGLIMVAIIAIAILAVWWNNARKNAFNQIETIGVLLMLGGAIGNMIDRIRNGRVTDFIDVFVQQYHWPVFNVADTMLSIGIVLVGYAAVLQQKKKRDNINNATEN